MAKYGESENKSNGEEISMKENIWLSKSISAIINNESGCRRKAKMWPS
jgi:hypothetical protein